MTGQVEINKEVAQLLARRDSLHLLSVAVILCCRGVPLIDVILDSGWAPPHPRPPQPLESAGLIFPDFGGKPQTSWVWWGSGMGWSPART